MVWSAGCVFNGLSRGHQKEQSGEGTTTNLMAEVAVADSEVLCGKNGS